MISRDYSLRSLQSFGTVSLFTRFKINETLKGRKDSNITRARKSKSQKGILNPFYGKGTSIKGLDIAGLRRKGRD
jgi:hypothetical protein